MNVCEGVSEYVCINSPGARMQMQMCLSAGAGCRIFSALLKAFSKWNDSIKGTMGILSPAM